MIDLIAAAGIGGITVGALVYLAMKGKVEAADAETERAYDAVGFEHLAAWNAREAHTRCSDALETARNRIERALSVETPKAAHGVRKMARILRGEQG
ncbi:hypothetical protein CDQ92_13260 [Sphingopyxis bauzanensis]|uniref:Uncharacterized protein n=1 Tax=Sphingopyxis bauzanensis TaxID=651663 RepID=A0A246JRV7_9SPHN|nr:hypothetical protein [Sphingopyxis bauzanensis]OWQ95745.1 hypothetical protein CDQ92_13260 [Sphingopyxis bauzanensis]GGJ39668.1 hypothetical protein GCM10011393_07410 [Sphingopyxis bauzanensis]